MARSALPFAVPFPRVFELLAPNLSHLRPAPTVVSSPSINTSSHNNGDVMGVTNRWTARAHSDSLTTSSIASSLPVHLHLRHQPHALLGQSLRLRQSTTTPGESHNLTNIDFASTTYDGCTQKASASRPTRIRESAHRVQLRFFGRRLNNTHNSYAWNAESEIKTAAGVNYTYDGDGNRVQKSNGKIYWYGAGSEVLDESDSSGNITDEYVYFGGKRVAHRVVSANALYFYGEDVLGTSRTIFTSAGALCYDADFYPFGGERAYTNTCPQNYKFESKERDSETNNDDFGARSLFIVRPVDLARLVRYPSACPVRQSHQSANAKPLRHGRRQPGNLRRPRRARNRRLGASRRKPIQHLGEAAAFRGGGAPVATCGSSPVSAVPGVTMAADGQHQAHR